MNVSTSVICPGVVFSSLLSERPAYAYVQEGFLLGSVVQHTSTQISDADMSRETTRKTVYISSYHSLDFLGCLYDSGSRVRQKTVDTVQEMAGGNKQEIVGWFVWRSCSSEVWEKMLLRERLVHQQLQGLLSRPELLFLILNSSRDANQNQPVTKYLLTLHNETEHVRVPLCIRNLGNTSNTEYKLSPPNPVIYSSPALRSVIAKLQCSEPGVEEATTLHARLEDSLKEQLQEASQAQHQHGSKLQRVFALRTLCYHNSIVPDFELPNEIDVEKEKLVNSNGAEASNEESVMENQTRNEESTNTEAHLTTSRSENNVSNSPGVIKQDTPRKKSPVKRLQGTLNGKHEVKRKSPGPKSNSITTNIDEDLNKLSVTTNSNGTTNNGTPEKVVVGVSPRSLIKNTRVSPLKCGELNGRLASDCSPSPPSTRRAVSANRASRPASVATKSKRRVSSNSPSVDNQVNIEDKSKNVWK